MRYILLSLQGIWRTCVFCLISLLPRRSKLAVFGAWKGDRFCDNPKYMMLYLLENTDFTCVWVGKGYLRDQMPHSRNFKFIGYGTWKAVWYAIRARYCFTCRWPEDISNIMWQGGAMRINLWHGIPLKYMGVKTPVALMRKHKYSFAETLRHKIFNSMRPSPNWTSTASKKMSQIMVECFPNDFDYARIWEWGTPRNDFIVCNRSNESLIGQLRDKYSRLLNFERGKKVVLYMPTWRMRGGRNFTFCGLSGDNRQAIEALLHNYNAVLIEKPHHVVLEEMRVDSMVSTNISVIGSDMHNIVDPQELYLVSDMLITDYSSAYIDFALLKRPCIHFIYDYEAYRDSDSGLAYDLFNVAAGPCVRTYEDLIRMMGKMLARPQYAPAAGFNGLVAFEDGKCASRIAAFMKGAK